MGVEVGLCPGLLLSMLGGLLEGSLFWRDRLFLFF